MRLVTLIALAAPLTFAASKDVTFHKDVEPVLQSKCQECHRPGEAGPMSFMTYKETRPWAKAIRAAVATRKMPPWHADPAYGHFANDRRLSEKEIMTIVAWSEGGAKEGDVKDAPKPRVFNDGWQIGKPDMILEMPVAAKIPATGEVPYSWIVVPVGLPEDRWIDKIEVRPGERSVVHHVVLYSREKGSFFMKDAKPGEIFVPKGRVGTPPKSVQRENGIWEFQANARGTEIVSLYVPGGSPYVTLPGQARFLKAGSDLVMQMHYTANGKETMDKTKVGIVFSKEAPKTRAYNTFVANPSLIIPPGADNHEVKAIVTLAEDVEIQALNPHMHVRGKAFQYSAIYPTGEREILLKVPKYDFNWQINYILEKPKKLPKGTKIEVIAWYDNSPNNPFNPDPKKEVLWGDQTWEEMIAGFIDMSVPVDFTGSDLVRGRAPAKTAGPANE